MFNIVLCDDNNGYLSLFKGIVKRQFEIFSHNHRQYKIGACLGSGEDLLEYIEKNKTDVLFLDIDMPGMTGFEIAKIISRDYNEVLIVFMSAYDNFVYESFDYLPFAYLRKEKILDDLPKVAKRINDKLAEQTKYIILTTGNKKMRINSKDILYFESVKNYFIAHMINGTTYSCRGTISKLENEIKTLDFYRTHSAFLVNLEHADRISGDGYLFVGNNKIPIAQKRAKEFKRTYLEFTRRQIGI